MIFTLIEVFDYFIKLLPLLIPIFIIGLILMVAALLNLIKKSVPMKEKILWFLFIIFIQYIGSILYFIIGSKKLDSKILETEEK